MIDPLPVPEVEEISNQEAFLLADQVRSPPPALEMLTVCELEGLLLPSSAVKDKLAGLGRITGGTDETGTVTVKLTGTITVVAPAAFRVIAAL